jgi:hypothetical protein
MKHVAIIGQGAGSVIILEFLIVFDKGKNNTPEDS